MEVTVFPPPRKVKNPPPPATQRITEGRSFFLQTTANRWKLQRPTRRENGSDSQRRRRPSTDPSSPVSPLTRVCFFVPPAVLLHVKRSDKDTFLFDTPAASEVDATVRELVKVQNLRGKVNRLAAAAEQLAMYGPMKLPEQQGLDDSTALLEDYDVKTGTIPERQPVQHGANYRQDPNERRTGDCPSDELGQVMLKTVEDAKALTAEKTTVALKRPTTSAALEEAINNIRGAVMIVYPMGLPDFDHVRQILEEREQLEGAESLEVMEVERASLWVFSKEMQSEKLLSDYVGKNDKSKVVAKLQKKGAGAPAREPVVSEEEQKAMIAFYHKKEAEMGRMALEDEDAYQNSSWANPKALKNAFSGVGEVSWRGGGK